MPTNMLHTIKVKNFKSLEDTRISFAKNTFFIGLNGVGKTTILQAIDFISAVSKGEVTKWLEARSWKGKDLTFYKSNKSIIEFDIQFQLGDKSYIFNFMFNKKTLKCSQETILYIDKDVQRELLSVKDGYFSLYQDKKQKINFKYNGSILSALETRLFKDDLLGIYNFFGDIRSAELLSPLLMKKIARESDNTIGLGGEKLSAFLNSLSTENKEFLQTKLQEFFPHVASFETKSLRSGWKTLALVEKYGDKLVETDSLHLSDGVLRILAILSQLLTTESILIFDEIEDGINQEFVEKLIDIIVASQHQTVVTTHSPLVLNFIDDDIAKESIFFVYKTYIGATKVINFYEAITRFKQIDDYELDLFGAGEVMQSVNLMELTDKLLKSDG